MTKLYKLTTQEFTTYNNTKWGECVTHETSGAGEMCGPGWLHAYTSPELAVLLNPIHANITNPVLWECEGIIQKTDKGLKVGTTKLTTIRQIQLPQATLFQKVAFGILVAQCVYEDSSFHKWAQNYLNGTDRTAKSAARAADSAKSAAWAAESAKSAARAAESAAWAAESAKSWAESWAAESAARAAESAKPINLDNLAKQALLRGA